MDQYKNKYKNLLKTICLYLTQQALQKEFSRDLFLFYSHLPAKHSFGFQSAESNYYFENIESCANLSLSKKSVEVSIPYCRALPQNNVLTFIGKLAKYENIFPGVANKFLLYHKMKQYHAKLAYGIFINNTYAYLPIFEKFRIPFIFVLYPGGGFGLNNYYSDKMLQEVFSSKMFRKVIVTMPVTKKYLLAKGFCTEKDIEYIYGGICQFKSDLSAHKFKYKQDKGTFDICFVAHKYSSFGEDKGYDVVIETAKILISKNKDFHIHVVGPWHKNIIDIDGFEDNIHFYGARNGKFFPEFYQRMDIFLSPNRTDRLFLGNFDGFPLGIEGAVSGVYLMSTDPLNMKPDTPFKDLKAPEIINTNPKDVADKILAKLYNLDEFYYNSKLLQQKAIEIFNQDYQMEFRLNLIKEIGGIK